MSLSPKSRRTLRKLQLEQRMEVLSETVKKSVGTRDKDRASRELEAAGLELAALLSAMKELGELIEKKTKTKKPSAKKGE